MAWAENRSVRLRPPARSMQDTEIVHLFSQAPCKETDTGFGRTTGNESVRTLELASDSSGRAGVPQGARTESDLFLTSRPTGGLCGPCAGDPMIRPTPQPRGESMTAQRIATADPQASRRRRLWKPCCTASGHRNAVDPLEAPREQVPAPPTFALVGVEVRWLEGEVTFAGKNR